MRDNPDTDPAPKTQAHAGLSGSRGPAQDRGDDPGPGRRADPATVYAQPDLLVADPDLTTGQKRRLLQQWAQDIEARQVGVEEGMGADLPLEPNADARRLQRIRDLLADLPDDGAPRTTDE